MTKNVSDEAAVARLRAAAGVRSCYPRVLKDGRCKCLFYFWQNFTMSPVQRAAVSQRVTEVATLAEELGFEASVAGLDHTDVTEAGDVRVRSTRTTVTVYLPAGFDTPARMTDSQRDLTAFVDAVFGPRRHWRAPASAAGNLRYTRSHMRAKGCVLYKVWGAVPATRYDQASPVGVVLDRLDDVREDRPDLVTYEFKHRDSVTSTTQREWYERGGYVYVGPYVTKPKDSPWVLARAKDMIVVRMPYLEVRVYRGV